MNNFRYNYGRIQLAFGGNHKILDKFFKICSSNNQIDRLRTFSGTNLGAAGSFHSENLEWKLNRCENMMREWNYISSSTSSEKSKNFTKSINFCLHPRRTVRMYIQIAYVCITCVVCIPYFITMKYVTGLWIFRNFPHFGGLEVNNGTWFIKMQLHSGNFPLICDAKSGLNYYFLLP